jgi:hypothetical protein
MNERDVSWAISRPVRVEVAEGPDGIGYRVESLDGLRRVTLSWSETTGRLLFGGHYVDVGDDFPAYLGLIDAVEASPDGIAILADE